jgi:hypothetical protein
VRGRSAGEAVVGASAFGSDEAVLDV